MELDSTHELLNNVNLALSQITLQSNDVLFFNPQDVNPLPNHKPKTMSKKVFREFCRKGTIPPVTWPPASPRPSYPTITIDGLSTLLKRLYQ